MVCNQWVSLKNYSKVTEQLIHLKLSWNEKYPIFLYLYIKMW